MKRLCLATILFISSFSLTTIDAKAADTVKIGVLAKRGAQQCITQWGDTGKYLSDKIGKEVEIIPLKFTEIEPKVENGEIDFILANSAFFAILNKKHNVQPIATLINSRQGEALKEFAGVILVRKDSPIQTLEDLKGKTFMCVKFSSFGGGHMAQRLLLENGIDPNQDFAMFKEAGKHDNVVMAVKAGMADAGTVRSDTLERMAAEGKINMDDFRVINAQDDDFPFVHSTQLYPEWPMAACRNTPADLAQGVANALIEMTPDSQAAQSSKAVGWSEPVDYSPVVDCLKTIQYDVFAN